MSRELVISKPFADSSEFFSCNIFNFVNVFVVVENRRIINVKGKSHFLLMIGKDF